MPKIVNLASFWKPEAKMRYFWVIFKHCAIILIPQIVMMFWLLWLFWFCWFVSHNLIVECKLDCRPGEKRVLRVRLRPTLFSYRFPWWFPLAAIMQGQIRRRISVDIELHWRNCCHCLCTLRRRTIYNDAENNDKDEEIRKKRDKQQLMTSWLTSMAL